MNVTKHGSKRIKQRLNIPKKSHKRLYQLLIKRGYKENQLKGDLKIWVEKRVNKEVSRGIIYNNHLFILDKNITTIITVFKIPNKLLVKLNKELC